MKKKEVKDRIKSKNAIVERGIFINLQDSITVLKGVGAKTAQLFHKVGVETVQDLLEYYPRGYETFPEPISIESATEDKKAAISAWVVSISDVKQAKNYQIFTLKLKSETQVFTAIWFQMPYLRNQFRRGMRYIFYGTVKKQGNSYQMEQPVTYTLPEYEMLLNKLHPKYPLTAGLTGNLVKKSMKQVFESEVCVTEYFPQEFVYKYKLGNHMQALQQLHFPNSEQEMLEGRKRLVFDEFFFFILAIQRLREHSEILLNKAKMTDTQMAYQLLEKLPYELTGAQKRVFSEIVSDVGGEKAMNRLIQGDVGSGKTILAVLALVVAVSNGYQGALMAPTEVLAKQHLKSIEELFQAYDIPISCILLTGSMTAKEKRIAYEKIASGEAQLIIGTHAMIQEKVQYHNLGLVVTDEQHRFGVRQREMLTEKGLQPHVLVMSATPIPRTLAIIVYGELDISVVDELPANRLPIKNCVVDDSYRATAYRFMEKEMAAGHQIYIICPMVEENESLDMENVIDYTSRLQNILPNYKISYLHGKMKTKEKNEIMERFAAGEIQILVSTTVIEVGINVPNATVMMVENAERFGLAQLHQLRGRVGRGRAQSYCIFMSQKKNKETKERLEVLQRSNDGFYIASEDLKLRGPGDLFGIRQSGAFAFKIGDIFQDAKILQEASQAVHDLLEADPLLEDSEHFLIKKQLEHYLYRNGEQMAL